MADEEHLFELYHSEIKGLSSEYQGSSAVLYSCVLAVVNFQSHGDPNAIRKNHSVAPISDIFSSTGEFLSLQTLGPHGSFQGLMQSVHNTPPIQEDLITVDVDDVSSARLARGISDSSAVGSFNNVSEYTSASIAGLLLFERHATVRGQVAQLLSGKDLPLKPEMTSTERGIKETELLSFSSLSAPDLYRNDQMQAAAVMLQAHVKALPNFTGTLAAGGDEGAITRRRYFRHLGASTFAQILAAERVREPVVVKQYYPLTDDLLLALHWPPPNRRIRKETWTWTGPIPVLTSAAPVIANKKSVKVKKGKAAEAKKPVKKGKKQAEVVQPTTISCTISTTTLTPAAHSIALVKRSSDPHAMSWLSIHVNGSLLGLRLETSSILTADFLAEQENESARDARSIPSVGSHQSLPELGAEDAGSPTIASVPSAEHHPLDSASKLDHVSSAGSLYQDPPRGVFFCHTEDDVRFTVCAGPCPQPIRKPDGFGSVCLVATFPDTMALTVCSNGTTKISVPQVSGTANSLNVQGRAGSVPVFDTAVGVETERFVGPGGTVLSVYARTSATYTMGNGHSVQFWKEIREADGSRLLIIRPPRASLASLAGDFERAAVDGKAVVSSVKSVQAPKLKGVAAFYQTLCDAAPVGWTCVKLTADGQVVFHSCPPDSSLLDSAEGIPHPSLHRAVRETLVDAETKSTVSTYADGRITVSYTDGRRECKFGDGTIITTHADGAMVSITKPSLPGVELDTEIDAMSRQHARGIEVPINKGGERVRSRISLPDGSAIVVKYDTRLTTITNGSIKLVRRDKTVLLLKDSGVITYTPRAAWNAKAAAAFASECADLPKPPTAYSRAVRIAGGNSTAALSTAGNSSPKNAPRSPTAQSKAMRTTEQGSATASTSAPSRDRKTVTAPGLVRRRTRSPARTASAAPVLSGKEKIEQEGEEDATFTFDINKFTCQILDYEFNSFDISLTGPDPLNPGVTLSGEVEGLKPPAVADKPMDPRLFVVNRSAEATEVLSAHQVNGVETLVRTCPDVKKITAPVHLQPSELGPATMNKYFVSRRLLGSRGDAFTFEEVFGERYWYPHSPPAAALLAEEANRAALVKLQKKKKGAPAQAAVPPPARYFETLSIIEQLPLSQAGHKDLQMSIKQCDAFRAGRLQSLDRFKVEEDRSKEELDEEEALSKRLKLAFKAAKVAAAKKKEQKAKQAAAAATPTVPEEEEVGSPIKHSSAAIPEGANEDGEEEEDLDFPGDDDEPKELDPEEQEVRETFEDFAMPPVHEDDAVTIHKDSLQEAFIRLFNRYIAADFVEHEIALCDECDGSFDEFTLPEFRALYQGMKAALEAEDEAGDSSGLRVSTLGHDGMSLASHSEEHSVISSPMYWHSAQGKQVMKSLPSAAPPLDLRKMEWPAGEAGAVLERAGSGDAFDEELEDGPVVQGRMVSTAHPAAGAALHAARMSNKNRAVTAPE